MQTWLVIVIALFMAGCGFKSLDPGERAVFAKFGEVIEKCYKEDFYVYNPFTTSVYELDIKPQSIKLEKMSAASYDIQEITLDIVVNYEIDGDLCHSLIKDVGADFINKLLIPISQDAAKTSTAKFHIEKLIQERLQVKKTIEDDLRARMEPYHIKIRGVNVTNFAPHPDYMRAVERKMIVAQEVQTAENERLKAVKLAERDVAIARGTAESSEILQKSIKSAPEFLRFKELDVLEKKWDGHFPTFISGGSIPLMSFDVGKIDKRARE